MDLDILQSAKAYYSSSISYVFSTSDILSEDIMAALYESALMILKSFFDLFQAVIYFSFYLFLIVAKVSLIVFPHIVVLFKIVVEFHLTQLTYSDVLFEFTFFALLLLYLYFRNDINKAWREFERSVAKKSKEAAKLAPHFLFFLSSFVFAIVGQKFLRHMASASVLPIFSVGIPFLSTLRILFFVGDSVKRASFYRPQVSLWIILATYHAVSTMLSAVPFSAHLLSSIVMFREMAVVILIWAQISPIFTDIVLDIAEPMLHRIASHIPSISGRDYKKASYDNQNIKSSDTNQLLQLLRFMHIVSDSHADFIVSLLQDGVALICALLFVFTPMPSIGTVIVAMLFPAVKSMRSITSISPHAAITTSNTAITVRPGKTNSNVKSVPRSPFSLSGIIDTLRSPSTSLLRSPGPTPTVGQAKAVTKAASSKRRSRSTDVGNIKEDTTTNADLKTPDTAKAAGDPAPSSTGILDYLTPFAPRKSVLFTPSPVPSKRTASGNNGDKDSSDKTLNISNNVATKSASVLDEEMKKQLRWLEYWLCFSALWLLRLYGAQIWHSWLMLACLWLQHSYFRGARKVVQILRSFGEAAVLKKISSSSSNSGNNSNNTYAATSTSIDSSGSKACTREELLRGQAVDEDDTVTTTPQTRSGGECVNGGDTNGKNESAKRPTKGKSITPLSSHNTSRFSEHPSRRGFGDSLGDPTSANRAEEVPSKTSSSQLLSDNEYVLVDE